MRTKALLCCAALAVGIATSAVAQSNVYSLNIVGYVNTPLVAGFNLIANPLDNGTNDLNSLFPTAGFGDTAYKYVNGAFVSAQFFGSWPSSGQSGYFTLVPGEGIFYQASGPSTNTFIGNVMTGNLSTPVPAGLSIQSSQAPLADTLGNLQFPAGFGDTAYFWNPATQGFTSQQFFGSWSPDQTLGVGQAFWAQTSAAANWTRTFNP